MSPLPSLFLSHGAPDLALHDTPARDHLIGLGKRLPRPRAILSVSAHFETARPTVVTDPSPDMIYDFRGFDRRLYEMVYPAPGSAEIADKAVTHLRKAGIEAIPLARRGYDHGTWVPLALMFPDADIPVVQLSVQPALGPRHHLEVGRALAPLRDEGVLIVGTGALTHNLRMAFAKGLRNRVAEVPDWVAGFTDWIADKAAAGEVDALVAFETDAPHAALHHPTPEHFLPFFVALGAAGEGAVGERIHASTEFAVLAMDCFAFGQPGEMAPRAMAVESVS